MSNETIQWSVESVFFNPRGGNSFTVNSLPDPYTAAPCSLQVCSVEGFGPCQVSLVPQGWDPRNFTLGVVADEYSVQVDAYATHINNPISFFYHTISGLDGLPGLTDVLMLEYVDSEGYTLWAPDPDYLGRVSSIELAHYTETISDMTSGTMDPQKGSRVQWKPKESGRQCGCYQKHIYITDCVEAEVEINYGDVGVRGKPADGESVRIRNNRLGLNLPNYNAALAQTHSGTDANGWGLVGFNPPRWGATVIMYHTGLQGTIPHPNPNFGPTIGPWWVPQQALVSVSTPDDSILTGKIWRADGTGNSDVIEMMYDGAPREVIAHDTVNNNLEFNDGPVAWGAHTGTRFQNYGSRFNDWEFCQGVLTAGWQGNHWRTTQSSFGWSLNSCEYLRYENFNAVWPVADRAHPRPGSRGRTTWNQSPRCTPAQFYNITTTDPAIAAGPVDNHPLIIEAFTRPIGTHQFYFSVPNALRGINAICDLVYDVTFRENESIAKVRHPETNVLMDAAEYDKCGTPYGLPQPPGSFAGHLGSYTVDSGVFGAGADGGTEILRAFGNYAEWDPNDDPDANANTKWQDQETGSKLTLNHTSLFPEEKDVFFHATQTSWRSGSIVTDPNTTVEGVDVGGVWMLTFVPSSGGKFTITPPTQVDFVRLYQD